MDVIFSRHALERMKHRSIKRTTVEHGLKEPYDVREQGGNLVYHKIVKEENKN